MAPTATNDNLSSLDHFHQDLTERDGRVQGALAGLFRHVAALRASLTPLAWADFCAQSGQHPIADLLASDPCTHRARSKPRGYAGDAVLMDLMYRHPAVDGVTTLAPAGRRTYRFVSSTPAARAVRHRRRMLAGEIDAVARRRRRPRVLILAAGHFREAELSEALRAGAIDRCLVTDHDPRSLDTIRADYRGLRLSLHQLNVLDLIRTPVDLGTFDLIYSAGLYDYLAHGTVGRLNEVAFGMLRPGGSLLACNYTPATVEAGYMEAFGDWFMEYRSQDALLQTMSGVVATGAARIETFHDPTGRVVFVRAMKTR